MRLLICALIGLGLWGGLEAQTTHLFVNDNVAIQRWAETFDIHDQGRHAADRAWSSPALSADSNALLSHIGQHTRLAPLLSISGQMALDTGDARYASEGLIGLALNRQFGKRLRLDAALYAGVSDGSPFERIGAANAETLTGVGPGLEMNGPTRSHADANFRLRYHASDIFDLELGKSKHFFGHGYRSLFLSDNAAAYPYFKIRTKIWNIEYSNLYAWQQGRYGPGLELEDKYTSTHFLSWNVSPRFNVHLFETIIWQGEDSLSSRGFDIYYLNPIIFYRPVEFAAGSADNAVIGFGMDYKIYPRYELYMALVFDEFLLDQFNAGDGWWGNKYGAQIGIKGMDVAGIEGLYAQAEFNAVRPFTYSHGSPLQNYAHQDEALAHPLGANFYEALLIGVYRKGDWEWRNQLSFVLKGDDKGGENLGGDIFRSYVNPSRNLGNFIGQGRQTEAVQNSLYLSRILDESNDLRIGFAYHFRMDAGEVEGPDHSFGLSIRSNFGDRYR